MNNRGIHKRPFSKYDTYVPFSKYDTYVPSRANVRDGREAVTLAELACRNTRWQNARFMLTLATAYAEAGRFADAVRTGKTAVTLAESAGDKQLASGIRGVLRLYEQGKTFAQGQ